MNSILMILSISNIGFFLLGLWIGRNWKRVKKTEYVPAADDDEEWRKELALKIDKIQGKVKETKEVVGDGVPDDEELFIIEQDEEKRKKG